MLSDLCSDLCFQSYAQQIKWIIASFNFSSGDIFWQLPLVQMQCLQKTTEELSINVLSANTFYYVVAHIEEGGAQYYRHFQFVEGGWIYHRYTHCIFLKFWPTKLAFSRLGKLTITCCQTSRNSMLTERQND